MMTRYKIGLGVGHMCAHGPFPSSVNFDVVTQAAEGTPGAIGEDDEELYNAPPGSGSESEDFLPDHDSDDGDDMDGWEADFADRDDEELLAMHEMYPFL